MSKLAIFGGRPVRSHPFPPYRTLGAEEIEAVNRVMEKGQLSRFIGAWHPDFWGGEEIRALEEEWAAFFNVKHAIAVNSCTSGLQCAIGALDLEPGDEVIVPPLTMSATVVAPLVFDCIPVFSDCDPATFCLDPERLQDAITHRTRAILAVDLFGHPISEELIRIAKDKGLYLVEDAAQAPGATKGGRYAGTLGDIGVFSLNYHKHIHCGEGGIVVTDDDDLALRVRLIRNHAESCVEGAGIESISGLIGFNFRLTEIQAAIAREQLKKLPELLSKRRANARWLSEELKDIPALSPPEEREDVGHAYYVHAIRYDEKVAEISRDVFVAAVKRELPVMAGREGDGVLIRDGYVRPLYLLPIFKQKQCYGRKGYPFTLSGRSEWPNYAEGCCPVSERLHFKELIIHELIHAGLSMSDMKDVRDAFFKVWEKRDELKGLSIQDI
ncbi:MAG TPA: DegT/DnrJ/EryC1/StrS family aminotransferase [Dissulfuribacter thermophilus]|uniref:DegT/DnrJ/EryC1/StrS family aminotransferase n=1 Tax=Dissulfuribacter thermophilus TaxID=1156395 RepID=A0A7V2SZG7_9BACT|nr:DegT/DnrJ/EryC1/StrS family aminotransferase [Dissulfuribacter thermophilus]